MHHSQPIKHHLIRSTCLIRPPKFIWCRKNIAKLQKVTVTEILVESKCLYQSEDSTQLATLFSGNGPINRRSRHDLSRSSKRTNVQNQMATRIRQYTPVAPVARISRPKISMAKRKLCIEFLIRLAEIDTG